MRTTQPKDMSDQAPGNALGRGRDLLAIVPLVSILVLTIMVSLLLWLLDRNETERLRTTLISDALWVEQTLRFQLSVDDDAIVRIAVDEGQHGVETGALGDRARLHLQNNPEVERIILFDASGNPTFSVPPKLGSLGEFADRSRRLAAAAATVRPVYSPLYVGADGDLLTDLAIGTADGGVLLATISIRTLIARQIPWWITEKYAVQLVDLDNKVLAEKARVEPPDAELTYRISIDPPLSGAWLSISRYRVSGDFSNNLLMGGVFGLALFAVLSLLILYRNGLKRHSAETRLRAEMAFRRAMEESLTVGLRARDHEGRILYVNNAFCQMTGFSAEELTGRLPPMPYWREDRVAETLARHDALNRGGLKVQSFETSFRRSDGTELEVQVFEAPLIDERGRHQGWMGSVIDITEQKKAADLSRLQAQQMQRTGRVIALGEMASSLAHELNQPLAAIASYAAGSLNILKADGNPQAVIPAIEKLSLQTERAGQIIRRIQDFVRKRDPKFEEVNLAGVIAETASFLATDASAARAIVKVDAEADLAPVRADRILLEQVVLNLMRNGTEAMTATAKGQAVIEVSLRREAGAQVIEVRDRGTGISPSVETTLFQPFVTSKAEGMGMGLSICRTIVELHRGRLEHRPNPGGGTIFSVILPEPQAERPAAE